MIPEHELQSSFNETLNEVRRFLTGYGVHDLRNIARILGVKAPTQFTREKLIKEITSNITGNKNNKCETRGRKPNKAVSADRYDEVIVELKNLPAGFKSKAEPEGQFLPSTKYEPDSLTQSVLAIKELLKTDDRMEIIIAVAKTLKKIKPSEK